MTELCRHELIPTTCAYCTGRIKKATHDDTPTPQTFLEKTMIEENYPHKKHWLRNHKTTKGMRLFE